MTDTHTTPDNVVQLTDQICREGPKAAAELEEKRKIAQRAIQLTVRQLERDAAKLEEGAIVGEFTLQRRHEMMDLARALRMTIQWLGEITQPEPKPNEPGPTMAEPA